MDLTSRFAYSLGYQL